MGRERPPWRVAVTNGHQAAQCAAWSRPGSLPTAQVCVVLSDAAPMRYGDHWLRKSAKHLESTPLRWPDSALGTYGTSQVEGRTRPLQNGRRPPEMPRCTSSCYSRTTRAAYVREQLKHTRTGARAVSGACDSLLQPVGGSGSVRGGAAPATRHPQSWGQPRAGVHGLSTASGSAAQPASGGSRSPSGVGLTPACAAVAERETRESGEPGAAGGAAGGGAAQRVVMYKGFGMVPFRVLVRLKVIQLTGVAGLAIPITCFLAGVRPGPVTP